MYVERTLETLIRTASAQFPALVLTGPRQVGKTTLLRHLAAPDRGYVTLDDPLSRELAVRDPGLFFQRFPPPVLIDEVQYAPGVLPHIKMMVDPDRRPGSFWLTGSQPFHLMRGVSESLAGRIAVLQLHGLSRRELAGAPGDSRPFVPTLSTVIDRTRTGGGLDVHQAYAAIWRGSLPGLALHPGVDRDLFYGSYVTTYLQRDVRDLARVGDEAAFLRFLRACAARTAQLLNVANLARDSDVAPNTARAWLSILQSTGVVALLEPYHTNITKRLVKAPKLHFTDTGLCAYLAGWSDPRTLEAGAMAGAILETWVVSEILKAHVHSGKQPRFHFFRNRDGREIDLLILQNGGAIPLEVKRSAGPGPDDVSAFSALRAAGLDTLPGGVVCFATQPMPITEGAVSIPVAAL